MTEKEKELLRTLKAKEKQEQRDKKKIREFRKLYPEEFSDKVTDADGDRIRAIAKQYAYSSAAKLMDEVERSLQHERERKKQLEEQQPSSTSNPVIKRTTITQPQQTVSQVKPTT